MPHAGRTARSLALAVALAACGRGGSGSGWLDYLASDPGFTLAISPSAVEVEPGATVQFQATGPAGRSPVLWLVDGVAGGGAQTGTISPSGLYTAPPAARAPVEVTCRSAVSPSRSATAKVTFPPSVVTVSPAEADVVLGESRQFTASVSHAVDQRVTWSGADAAGLFRAPAPEEGWWLYPDMRVVAASVATGETGSAIVHLRLPPPVLDAVTGPAAAGETVTLTGSWITAEATVLFPTAAGEPIPVRGTLVSRSRIDAVVPQGATSGPMSVQLRMGVLGPARSNEVPFLRAPRIRVRAGRRDVAAGEATPLRVAWLGAPGPLPLAWSADVGSVVDGAYVAPASIAATTYAHVSACIVGTNVCDAVVLGVQPFLVDPDPALVSAGASLVLDAHTSGAPAGARWWRLAGGGGVSTGGVYTSSAALEDAGTAWLAAAVGDVAAVVPVGVRGAVPGLVNRIIEYADHRAAAPEGAFAEAIAVSGTRLFVVAADAAVLYGDRAYVWIDVYDIADPARPSWIGAVESATRPTWLVAAHDRLFAFSSDDWSAAFDATAAVYDISGELPVLVERRQTADAPWAGSRAFDGEHLYFFGNGPSPSTLAVNVYATGGDVPLALVRSTSLPFPSEAMFAGVTVERDRAYLSYGTGTFYDRMHIAVFDFAAEPPRLIAEVDGGGSGLAAHGPLLFAEHYQRTFVYDRREDGLGLVASFPLEGWLAAADGTRAVLGTRQSGLAIVDISDPAAPRLTSTLFSTVLGGSAYLVGDLLVFGEEMAGVAIYDVSKPGGLPAVDVLDVPQAPPGPTGWLNDMAVVPPYLYATGATFNPGGWVATYDLSATPPVLVSWTVLTDTGFALAVTGALLAVGSPDRLDLLDRSAPQAPVPVSSLPIATSSLAAEGTRIFAGSLGTDLVVIDAADPTVPAEVARLDLGGNPFTMRIVSPGILAVAVASVDRRDGWLALLDVATPATPIARSVVPLGAPAWGLAVDGAMAYVAFAGGLAIVDVSNPDAPAVRSRTALQSIYPYGDVYDPAMACSVAIHRGIVYVGTLYANGTIHGFDVRDPAWPRLVSLSAHASFIDAIIPVMAFHEDRGFLGFGSLVLDVRQPRNVVLQGAAPPELQR